MAGRGGRSGATCGTIGGGDNGWALRLALGLAVFLILTALLSTYLGRGGGGGGGGGGGPEPFFAGRRPPTSAALRRRKVAARGYRTA
jgi:hypothetical protein